MIVGFQEQEVSKEINNLADEFHQYAKISGFWEGDAGNLGTKVALIHAEVSEFLEVLREEDWKHKKSTKIPQYLALEEEAADVFIRLLELCSCLHLDVGAAAIAKHAYNQTRPYKHGKQF